MHAEWSLVTTAWLLPTSSMKVMDGIQRPYSAEMWRTTGDGRAGKGRGEECPRKPHRNKNSMLQNVTQPLGLEGSCEHGTELCGSIKGRQISFLVERPVDSQEEPCSMVTVLVNYYGPKFTQSFTVISMCYCAIGYNGIRNS